MRGDAGRTAENSLGMEGGLRATDNVELAKKFGNKLELVPYPRRVLKADAFDLANMAGRDDFSEMTAFDWQGVRQRLKRAGYDAVNLGSGHMDGANDFWLLDEHTPRTPVV